MVNTISSFRVGTATLVIVAVVVTSLCGGAEAGNKVSKDEITRVYDGLFAMYSKYNDNHRFADYRLPMTTFEEPAPGMAIKADITSNSAEWATGGDQMCTASGMVAKAHEVLGGRIGYLEDVAKKVWTLDDPKMGKMMFPMLTSLKKLFSTVWLSNVCECYAPSAPAVMQTFTNGMKLDCDNSNTDGKCDRVELEVRFTPVSMGGETPSKGVAVQLYTVSSKSGSNLSAKTIAETSCAAVFRVNHDSSNAEAVEMVMQSGGQNVELRLLPNGWAYDKY